MVSMAGAHKLLKPTSPCSSQVSSPCRCFYTTRFYVSLATSPLERNRQKYRAASLCIESCIFSRSSIVKPLNNRRNISCHTSMVDGHSSDPKKSNLEHLVDEARKYGNQLPRPVKSFPWNRVLDNFVRLILDLAWAVIKYLSAPLLAVTSLSEMSYCAHERKLFLVPFTLVIGFSFAEILKETAVSISPFLKDAEVPWHLFSIAAFLTLLKLPGPYYPYWGRVFIPHFANGGLLRLLYSTYLWYRRRHNSEDIASALNLCEDNDDSSLDLF